MLALPALWYGGISMLLAVIPLLPGRSSWAPPAPDRLHGSDSTRATD
jgi:hypothetical protein